MHKSTHPTLKIADTPTDDDVPLSAVAKDEKPETGSTEAAAATPLVPTKPGRTSPTEHKRRGRRGSVQRLTPEEMDEEIDRVHHLNGRPTLARDTYPAD